MNIVPYNNNFTDYVDLDALRRFYAEIAARKRNYTPNFTMPNQNLQMPTVYKQQLPAIRADAPISNNIYTFNSPNTTQDIFEKSTQSMRDAENPWRVNADFYGPNKQKGIKGWFANTKKRVQSGGPLLDFKGPELQNVKNARTKVLGTNLWRGGPKVSTAANALNAGIQGVRVVKGFYDNSQTDTDISDLKQDIRELKLSNPMYADNLTPDQLKTLRQLDSGTQGADFGDALEGGLKGIPSALFSALMGGLTGGPFGAVIGGAGSLINSGIEGYGKAQQDQMSELQGLYEALNQGYSDYRSMKRPSNLYTSGLQSRYRNMYN